MASVCGFIGEIVESGTPFVEDRASIRSRNGRYANHVLGRSPRGRTYSPMGSGDMSFEEPVKKAQGSSISYKMPWIQEICCEGGALAIGSDDLHIQVRRSTPLQDKPRIEELCCEGGALAFGSHDLIREREIAKRFLKDRRQ